MFYWFSNHLPYIDHENTKFSYINTMEMRKSSLWKTSRWHARMIHTISKNNNKANNGNQDRIIKAFEKLPVREIILSIAELKYFICTHLTILLLLTFSNFLDWENPRILCNLRLLFTKPSASAFYYFIICKKNCTRI